MERAAAGTSLRGERRSVAPGEGVIAAPGLIPAKVPELLSPPPALLFLSPREEDGEGGREEAVPRPCAHPGGRALRGELPVQGGGRTPAPGGP